MIKNATALGLVNISGKTGVLLQIEADTHVAIKKFAQKHIASAKGVSGVKILPFKSGPSNGE